MISDGQMRPPWEPPLARFPFPRLRTAIEPLVGKLGDGLASAGTPVVRETVRYDQPLDD